MMAAVLLADAPSQAEFNALEARLAAIEAVVNQPPPDPNDFLPIGLVWHQNSGNNSEKVTSLPISGVQFPTYHVVYSIQLPTIFAGDLIEAFATFEVTNPYPGLDIMICRVLRIGDAATSTTGTEISEEAGQNVPYSVHHGTYPDFGSIRGVPSMSEKYVNFIACANIYGHAGKAVAVEQDYGRLIVKVTRAAALEN